MGEAGLDAPSGVPPMLDTVRIALGRPSRGATLFECRDCGTAVPPDEEACPACGSTEVARYEL